MYRACCTVPLPLSACCCLKTTAVLRSFSPKNRLKGKKMIGQEERKDEREVDKEYKRVSDIHRERGKERWRERESERERG